jgi:hypothetical protein
MLHGYECIVDDPRYHRYVAALSVYGIAVDERLIRRGSSARALRCVGERDLELGESTDCVFRRQ